MGKAVIILFLFMVSFGCNNGAKQKASITKISFPADTTLKDDTDKLGKKEADFEANKQDSLGLLIGKILFNVKTDDKKDYENGLIPWASIEKPEEDIPNLVDKNKIVIDESKVTVIIDYPLTNEYRFTVESKSGFTRAQLLKDISKNYYSIYAEEEQSATIKTIPLNKRTTLYNRNQTNGKYGIWGHDIADLVLADILVYKTLDGQIILSLNIES